MHTRIAPTPSGYLHIGNACSFLLTYRLANRYSGILRLRIDDLDSNRIRPEYLSDVFEVLSLLEISYEYGPVGVADFQKNHSQFLRIPLYEALLKELCDTGLVYACICSRKQLAENSGQCYCRQKEIPLGEKSVAWRMCVPDETVIRFIDDKLGKQEIYLAKEVPHFIIRKRDGLPAYQIASLADDVYYGIDYIVRGQDLLTSTAIQLFLAQLTGKDSFMKSRFFHHPLVNNIEGEKLSKSAGDLSVKKFLQTATARESLEEAVNSWIV